MSDETDYTLRSTLLSPRFNPLNQKTNPLNEKTKNEKHWFPIYNCNPFMMSQDPGTMKSKKPSLSEKRKEQPEPPVRTVRTILGQVIAPHHIHHLPLGVGNWGGWFLIDYIRYCFDYTCKVFF